MRLALAFAVVFAASSALAQEDFMPVPLGPPAPAKNKKKAPDKKKAAPAPEDDFMPAPIGGPAKPADKKKEPPPPGDDFMPAPIGGPAKPAEKKKEPPPGDEFMPAPLGGPAKGADKNKKKEPPPGDEFMPVPLGGSKETKKAPTSQSQTRVVITGPTEPLKPGDRPLLSVKVFDANDKPMNADLKVTVDFGIVTPPLELDVGEYQLTYVAPEKTPPGRTAILKVNAKERGGKSSPASQLVLMFKDERPAVATVTQPDKTIEANTGVTARPRPARVVFANDRFNVRPGTTGTVRFRVEDAEGRSIPPDGVELKSSGGGKFTNIRPEGSEYVAEFEPAEKASGEQRLYAEAQGEALVGESTVSIGKGGLIADEAKVGVDVSGFAGGLTNFGKMASPAFELAGEYGVTSSIRAGLFAGLSPSGANVESGTRKADISLKIIPVLVRANYVRPLGPVDVYGGGMAGPAFTTGTITTAGGTKDFSKTVFDLVLFAGAGLPLGPGVALVELRMGSAVMNYEDATTRIKGNVGGLSGALGYKLEL